MPTKLLPQTFLGKLSVGLALALPVMLAVGTALLARLYPTVPAGDSIVADIAARPGLAIPMLLGLAAGLAALITGGAAIFIKKERSVLVAAAVTVGLLLALFLLGEVAAPH